MRNIRPYPSFGLMLIFLVLAAVLPVNADTGEKDILAKYGFRAYEGVIPGYIDDRSCSAGGCHTSLCEDFSKTDKAHSFLKVRQDRFIADFSQTFYHDLSDRYYEMVPQGDDLIFRRYQKDDTGARINELELKVAYLHGSGSLARAYIIRAPNGELYQLPLVWYNASQSWGMGPGFDTPDHIGIHRLVQRQCQFCHNGYSELPEGGDHFSAPRIFPEKMTEGIGCQRCHGPGAEHTRLGLLALEPGARVSMDDLRQSIMNQENLSPQRNDEVCNQCHERYSKNVPALRHFGRGAFSYRAGAEPLSDYLVQIEVKRGGTSIQGRIGAISQPTLTKQSRCYIESGGKLTCVTCHDPHRRIPASERAEFYRAACSKCHAVEDCPVVKNDGSLKDGPDCVACHMPKKPSTVQDFPITDHLISRRPQVDVPPTPLREIRTQINDAWVTEPGGEQGELFRLLGLAQAGSGPAVMSLIQQQIDRVQPNYVEPYLILVQMYIRYNQWANAEKGIQKILLIEPDNDQALGWMGLARFATGRYDEAIAIIKDAVTKNPRRTDTRFNLGLILFARGKINDAQKELEKVLEMDPYLTMAWYYLGRIHEKEQNTDQAIEKYRRSLEIEPSFGRGYIALGKALLKQGQRDEAARYWRHGIKFARDPEPIRKIHDQIF